MAKKKNQLSMHGFKELGKPFRRFPQPHVRKFKGIKRYELLYRPFDLRFRGFLHKWLEHLERGHAVHFKKILDKPQTEIINLYLFPQTPNSKWLSQEEVAQKIKGIKRRKLRKILVNSLMLIWKKIKS